MYLAENRVLRLVVLCAMYIAQGLPFGFITIAVVAYLTKNGVTEEATGYLIAVWTVPWSFKFLWGPLIDRFTIRSMGSRRPWILFAQCFMALTIAAMIAISDMTKSMGVLGALVIIHNIFGSLQDVSVDAMAVDVLTEDERGRANGLMYGSSYLGFFLGSAGLGWVLANHGLQAALITQVSLLLVIMLFPFFVRERRGDLLIPGRRTNSDETNSPAHESVLQPRVVAADLDESVFKNLFRAFSIPSSLLAGMLALGTRLGSGVLTAVAASFYINQLGWSDEEYTGIQGSIGLTCGLGGATIGGLLADYVGHKRLASISAVLMAVVWISFSLAEPFWDNKTVVTLMLGAQTFLEAVFSVSLFALFMTVSWPRVAATQFTAYMALMNLSTTTGSAFAGFASSQLSVGGIFAVAGAIQLSLVGIIWLIKPNQTRERLGND